MKSTISSERSERRKKEGKSVIPIPKIPKKEIEELLAVGRSYAYNTPFYSTDPPNQTSVKEDIWLNIDKKGNILTGEDHRPMILEFTWSTAGRTHQPIERRQFRELYILTYDHWKQCPPGVAQRRGHDGPFFNARLVDPRKLPRIDRDTMEMFEEDILSEEKRSIFDE
ncbi:MAG: hypothetical protein ACXAEN_23165 [Candidatus Thorarchaeota archaeon]|jgi:hypothetical protein